MFDKWLSFRGFRVDSGLSFFAGMLKIIGALLTVHFLHCCAAQEYAEGVGIDKWTDICPNIFPKVFVGFGPKGNESAGNYEKKDNVHNFRECLSMCCEDDKCNVVFMYQSSCFLVSGS